MFSEWHQNNESVNFFCLEDLPRNGIQTSLKTKLRRKRLKRSLWILRQRRKFWRIQRRSRSSITAKTPWTRSQEGTAATMTGSHLTKASTTSTEVRSNSNFTFREASSPSICLLFTLISGLSHFTGNTMFWPTLWFTEWLLLRHEPIIATSEA